MEPGAYQATTRPANAPKTTKPSRTRIKPRPGTQPDLHEKSGLRVHIALVAAHMEAVALGTVPKETLAWMLDVKPEEIDMNSSRHSGVNLDDLATELGLGARAGNIVFR